MRETDSFTNTGSLTDELVDIIRERILRGEYKIGEKIKENQIATEFRVSRTPIREAFKQLETEGLMDYIPNRGCYARGFTERDIEDIYAVRKALELLAVEWAVQRITAEQLAQMQTQLDRMEIYMGRGENRKAMDSNADFHDVIYCATGSRFMRQVLHSYKEYIEQTRRAVSDQDRYLQEVFSEHRAVFLAIKDRDSARAQAAMAAHLDGSRRRARLLYHIDE